MNLSRPTLTIGCFFFLFPLFVFLTVGFAWGEEINYLDDQFRFNRVYYKDEQLERYPVFLNEAELDIIYRAQTEFNAMLEDNKLIAIKTAEIALLNVLGFGSLEKNPEMMLSKRWYIEKELGGDLGLKYLNWEKISVAEDEVAVDFHLHTIFSFDSVSHVESFLLKSQSKGLGAIAVTDHNHLDGIGEVMRVAERLKYEGRLRSDFIVIPGEEISTHEGAHIGALFIKSYIEQGMTNEETIREIHAQGGLAFAMHPGANAELGVKLAQNLDLDAVEVANGSDFLPYDFYRNLKLNSSPKLKGKAKFSASNTHMSQGVAWLGYTVVSVDEKTPEGIKAAVRSGNTKPVFMSLYKPYRRFFENQAIDRIYWAFDTYDRVKRNLELLCGYILFSSDFRVVTTWDESLHDIFNVVGIYRAYKNEDDDLKEPVKLSRMWVTYGMVNVEYDFLLKKTNLLVKFMF
ncbi:MAG: PHP domain-containing protein [bacterium]